MSGLTEFSKLTSEIKKDVIAMGGRVPSKTESPEKYGQLSQALIQNLPETMQSYRNLRKGSNEVAPSDVTFGQYVKELYGFNTSKNGGFSEFLYALGVDSTKHTLMDLASASELREIGSWIIPEVVLDALRLGIEANNFESFISISKPIKSNVGIVPHINMPDSMPRKMGEAERFSVGKISMGSRNVSVEKIGMGIEISDEVKKWCPIDLLGVELEGIGMLMNHGTNAYMIETLLNGEQQGGSYSAPVIGVTTVGQFKYKDIKRILTRMKNMNKKVQFMLSSEENELDVTLLPEVVGLFGTIALLGINPDKTDVKNITSYSHGLMPDDQIMFIDPKFALGRLVASPLAIENERNAASQLNNLYMSTTFGLYKLKKDSAILLDKSLDFTVQGFPAYMDIAAYQRQKFGGV